MQDYKIDVARIEELQMISDIQELDQVFSRAKSTIVCGSVVILGRKEKNSFNVFDRLETLPDLEQYRIQVYKYLKTTEQ